MIRRKVDNLVSQSKALVTNQTQKKGLGARLVNTVLNWRLSGKLHRGRVQGIRRIA
jgi:hypothetical protein